MAFRQTKQQPLKQQQGWGSGGGFGTAHAFGQPTQQQSPVAKAIPQPRMPPGANPFAAGFTAAPPAPPPSPPGFGVPQAGFAQGTAPRAVFGAATPLAFGQSSVTRAPLPQRAHVATEFNFGKPQPPPQPGFVQQPAQQPPTVPVSGLRWGQPVPHAPLPNWGQGPVAPPVAPPQAPVAPISNPVPPPAWGNWGSNATATQPVTPFFPTAGPVKPTLPAEWSFPPPVQQPVQPFPPPVPQPQPQPQPVPWSNSNTTVPVRFDFTPQPPPPMPSVEWPPQPVQPVPPPVPVQPPSLLAQLLMQPTQPQPLPSQPVQQPQPAATPQPARPATKLEPAPKLPARRKSPARLATPPPPTRAAPADMTPPRSNLRALFFRDDLRAAPMPAPKAPAVTAATQTAEDELAAAAAVFSAVTLETAAGPQAVVAPAAMPTLRDPELYWCSPSLAELAAAEAARPGALAAVEGFVLGARGRGQLRFLAPVDLRGAPTLDDVAAFEARAVAVYAGAAGPPPPGQGLNVPTEVTLLSVFPRSRRSASSGGSGSDTEAAEGAEAAASKAARFLRKLQAAPGTRFVAYDAAAGTWRFKLEHF